MIFQADLASIVILLLQAILLIAMLIDANLRPSKAKWRMVYSVNLTGVVLSLVMLWGFDALFITGYSVYEDDPYWKEICLCLSSMCIFSVSMVIGIILHGKGLALDKRAGSDKRTVLVGLLVGIFNFLLTYLACPYFFYVHSEPTVFMIIRCVLPFAMGSMILDLIPALNCPNIIWTAIAQAVLLLIFAEPLSVNLGTHSIIADSFNFIRYLVVECSLGMIVSLGQFCVIFIRNLRK